MSRYACSMGLTIPYQTNPQLGLIIRMAIALALVPHEAMEDAFQILKQLVAQVQNEFYVNIRVAIGRILEYIRTFWLGRIGPMRFSVSGDVNRTNNLLEAWHRSFNAMIEGAHPNFYFDPMEPIGVNMGVEGQSPPPILPVIRHLFKIFINK